MNFLNVFEQRVGSLFGATAQGATAPFSFKKLAKKAAREMEAETFVVNGVDTAPALYTILVSSDDDLVMRPLYPQLTTECAQFIEGQAQGKGYVFVGQPVVRFMADPSLKSGRFSVFAENVDAQTLEHLREEEQRFLGADTSSSNGLGGAAAEQFQQAAAQPVAAYGAQAQSAMQAMPQGNLRPIAQPVSSMDAGLDIFPDNLDDLSAIAPVGQAVQPLQAAGAQSMAQAAQQPLSPAANVAAEIAGGAAAGYAMAQQAAAPLPQQTNIPQQVAQVTDQAAGAQAIPATQGVPTAAQAAAPQTVRVQQAVAAPAAAPITCLLIDRSSGRTYTANAPRTILGRERNSGGIVLHDPNVSRAHAELTFDGRSWQIRDLNSTNGTLVNDVDIDKCALCNGDLITLGVTNLEFREN